MQRTKPKLRRVTALVFAASMWLHAPYAVSGDSLPSPVDSTSLDATSNLTTADAPVLADRKYSLAELLDIALDINPQTREAAEEAHQAELATQLVKSQYAPQVSIKAVGGAQRTPLAIPSTVSPAGYFISSTHEALPSLELKWLLFDFGRRKAQLEDAEDSALAAQSGLLGAREKLVFDVSDAYFEAVSAQGRIRAAEKALDSARLTESAVSEQREHGRATVLQSAETQRQTAAMRLAMTKAQGTAHTTFATLVATIGLPPQTHFELALPGDASSAKPAEPLETLINDALDTRPDVIAAREKLAASGAKVDTTRAAYKPTISLSTQVFQNIGAVSSDGSPYSSINRTGYGVFIVFEWPLFDGGMRKTNVAIAMSQRDAAEDALAVARNAATRQVVQAYDELETRMANKTQTDAYVHAADIAYQTSLASYRHGLGNITDLTGSEAALAQAQADLEDADAAVQIGQAALALATGRPPASP